MHHHSQKPHTESHVIHWARWYDLLSANFPMMRATRRTMLEVAAPEAGERVLDVGCGTGRLARALKAQVGAGEVHGIDPSREMIDLAKAKATKAGVRVDFQLAPIEALPFPDASFDLVTSTLMLHHLSDEAKRNGLAEVRRVLRPGGRFWAFDFDQHSHSPLGHLLALFGHRHPATAVEELVPLLEAAGFAQVEQRATRHRGFVFLCARPTAQRPEGPRTTAS